METTIIIKENFMMILELDMVKWYLAMEIYMKETGRMTRNMEMDYINTVLQMKIIKDNGIKIKSMVKGNTHFQMAMHITGHSTKIKCMDLLNTLHKITQFKAISKIIF